MKTTKLSKLYPEFFTDDNACSQIYTGAELGCRCGCKGNYYGLGSRGYNRARNKIRYLDPEVVILTESELNGATYDWPIRALENKAFMVVGSKWVDCVFPNNKTITLHFD